MTKIPRGKGEISPDRHPGRKIFAIIFFLSALAIPGLFAIVGLKAIPGFTENRNLSGFPKSPFRIKTLGNFAREFDAFANDNFGFRDVSIVGYSFVRKALGSSMVPESVINSKSNWLIKNDTTPTGSWPNPTELGRWDLDEYRGTYPSNPAAISHWNVVFRDREAFARVIGAHFLVVIPPNKEQVYPEELPNWMEKVGNSTRVNNVMEMFRLEHIDAVYLRDALIYAKEDDLNLYYKYDSHWNPLGAMFGAGGIINHLRGKFPNIPEFTASDFRVTRTAPMRRFDGHPLDLAMLIGNPFLKENDYRVEKVSGFCTTKRVEKMGDLTVETFVKDDNALPSAVIYTDSYSDALRPVLAEYFRRTVFANVWEVPSWKTHQFPIELVMRERPDILIYLRNEKGILGIADNPLEIRSAAAPSVP